MNANVSKQSRKLTAGVIGKVRPYRYTVFATNRAGDVMCKEHAHDLTEARIQAEGLSEAHGYETEIAKGVF